MVGPCKNGVNVRLQENRIITKVTVKWLESRAKLESRVKLESRLK